MKPIIPLYLFTVEVTHRLAELAWVACLLAIPGCLAAGVASFYRGHPDRGVIFLVGSATAFGLLHVFRMLIDRFEGPRG